MANTGSDKDWLQRLKNESWEAELLVSAIAIFGTLQLFAFIDWTTALFFDFLHPSQYSFGYMIAFFGVLAISILAAMFVIHFLLRSYWIGLVGLNSVFPDYSEEDSVYSKIYTQKILSILPKLTDTIDRVDELCSVIFSAAFCWLMVYAYSGLFASAYLILFNLLSGSIPNWLLLIPLCLIALILSTQIGMNIFANIKATRDSVAYQTAYFYAVKLGNILVLGPIYKLCMQIMMIFGSNFKKKKHIAFLIMSFVAVGAIVAMTKVWTTNLFYLVNHSYYQNFSLSYGSLYRDNNYSEAFLYNPEIASELIEDTVLRVFIPVYRHEKTAQMLACDKPATNDEFSNAENRNIRRQHLLECVQTYHTVTLNDVPVEYDLLYSYHPTTGQKGVNAYIDLSEVNNGTAILAITKHLDGEQAHHWQIPFYVQK